MRSGMWQRQPWDLSLCGRMCAPQGPPGRRAARVVRSGGMLRRSTPCTCAVLPCGRPVDSLASTSTEAVGKLSLGARHTARRRLRRAVCEGAGLLELDARVQRALRTPSPLLPHLRGESVRWGTDVGSAPERGEGAVALPHESETFLSALQALASCRPI